MHGAPGTVSQSCTHKDERGGYEVTDKRSAFYFSTDTAVVTSVVVS